MDRHYAHRPVSVLMRLLKCSEWRTVSIMSRRYVSPFAMCVAALMLIAAVETAQNRIGSSNSRPTPSSATDVRR